MSERADFYPKPRVLGSVLILMGVGLSTGGALLLARGGSPYYLPAGLALAASGYFTFRGRPLGGAIYGWLLLATVAWALAEVGLDGWALMPRIVLFAVLGLWFLLPRAHRGLVQGPPRSLLRSGATRAIVAGIALSIVVLLLSGQPSYRGEPPAGLGAGAVHNPTGEWADYGATRAGTRFAPHDEINRSNVTRLERAWVYRTGVAGTFKATPLQVGDTLYLCAGANVVIALDAENGQQRWRYDPHNQAKFGFWDTCRGVSYYRVPAPGGDGGIAAGRPLPQEQGGIAAGRPLPQEEGGIAAGRPLPQEQGGIAAGRPLPQQEAACAERVFTATTDARLIALDARTGERCAGFGNAGEVSLLAGMGQVEPGFYFVTSPPTLSRNTLVLGGWVADNQQTSEPSGVVRGFDPVTGELKWAWDLGDEARTGLPPQGETFTRGTPNVWSLMSADDELGLVYVPTGNATPDYVGGHRSAAMDRYSSSVVALDGDTGQVRWHFQTTHHDIWDYDVPSQPTLVDVPVDGTVRKAVLVPTKRAQLFMLDRETGKPLAAVTERPVPQTDVEGEWTTATQPFSTGLPAFDRGVLREADMWGMTPFDQLACRLAFRALRYEGPLTPPSLGGSLLNPGVAGGMNWGSIAVDEVNDLAVVNVIHLPMTVTLIPRERLTADTQFGVGGRQAGTPYGAVSMPFFSPLFAPCLSPPYGEMAVIDLTTRKLVWRRPVGTARDLGPLGMASHLPLPMGVFMRAGTLVTGGGLIFTAGVADRRLRAMDELSGEEVWSDDIPATAEATPMSYVSPQSGRQTVLVTLPASRGLTIGHDGGSADGAQTEGGYVIAYRLPLD